MKKNINLIVLLFFILAGACILSMLIGSVRIAPYKLVFAQDYRGILQLRVSRIILCAVAGASLAVVGAILQSLFKNPLANPYILGISSGSGLGAVCAIALGLSLIHI